MCEILATFSNHYNAVTKGFESNEVSINPKSEPPLPNPSLNFLASKVKRVKISKRKKPSEGSFVIT